jgi:hypothetical protein
LDIDLILPKDERLNRLLSGVPLRWADDAAASARSAPRSHEIANGEIEADEHHERDNPLVALGRTVRDDKHAAVVDGRRASPEEGANF